MTTTTAPGSEHTGRDHCARCRAVAAVTGHHAECPDCHRARQDGTWPTHACRIGRRLARDAARAR